MKKSVMSLSLMISLIGTLVFVTSSFALLTEHLNYDGCDSCHSFHGSGSGYQLLAGVDTEATCLACHGPLTPVATEVAVHDPAGVGVGNQGYITCRECHGARSNEGSNIKLVGYDWDPVVDPSKTTVFANPAIRVELTTSDINSPVYENVTFEARPDDFKRSDNAGVCEACHNAGPTSGPTVLLDHEWGDCTICHMHDDGFKKRQCVECHDVNATLVAGAPQMVNTAGASDALVGAHLYISSGDTIVGLTDQQWTVQCIGCHAGHSGDVIIPNNPTVGIQYNATILDGIGLGGTANVSGFTTEAEICWGCHAAEGVSEWGVNSDTNGTANDYDFGDIYTDVTTTTLTSNWVGAWWKSGTAKFGYKTGQIQSTHAVYNTATTAGIDPVDEIRCSYCHDVHELNLASNDSTSGKPYLRGNWMGSPYREDGAPQAGDSWLIPNGNYGAVPRSGIDSTELGGYQIDQNNGNPTTGGNPAHTSSVDSSWALANSAGLCTLCHDTDVDNLNEFGTPANAWVGTNGHANAAIGGSGSASGLAVYIFSMAIRNPSGALL